MGNLLTSEEVAGLTGAKSRPKQCEVLRNNGYQFLVRCDGSPAITWDAVNSYMCKPANNDEVREDGFDLDALDRAG